jgi:tetratricopeptide (TPR) repeat protein
MRKLSLALGASLLAGLLGCASKEQTSLKIYVNQKLYDKAIAQGGVALAKTPDSGDTHYFMGAAYWGKDNDLKPEAETYAESSEVFVKKAYYHFMKAKELAPGPWGKDADENVVAMFGRHYNRGIVSTKKGEHATAAVEYRLASFADPENYQGYYAHAAALLPMAMNARRSNDEKKFLEMSDAVLGDLQKVIDLKPTEREVQVSAWQSLGEVQYLRGDTKSAQESYGKAVELDPENYELIATFADRYYNAEDWQSAASYYEQSLAIQERLNLIEESDVELYGALAGAYGKLNKRDEAVVALEKALKLKPNDPDIMYNIMVQHYKAGEAAEKEGQMDVAKEHCHRCIQVGNDLIRVDANRMEAWQVRGYCKRIVGDTAGAALDLKKFQDLRGRPGAN